jgi:glutathione S-transferase
MKLYNSLGPNPHVVRMFMAEKGIDIAKIELDLRGGENRKAPFLAKNPTGTSPALELDDGTVVSEVTAICEYLEEKHPNPPLIGRTAEERVKTRMWVRRVDLGIVEPMTMSFHYGEGLQMFKDRLFCIPEAAPGLKELAQRQLTWLDGLMGSNEFITGKSISLADILLYPFLAIFSGMGQPINPKNKWVAAWYERMAARPSAKA